MIALRARLEAFAIAQEVERSRIPASPPLPAGETAPPPVAYAQEREPIYEPRRILLIEEPLEPGPPWITWLLAGCITTIALATIFILKIMR